MRHFKLIAVLIRNFQKMTDMTCNYVLGTYILNKWLTISLVCLGIKLHQFKELLFIQITYTHPGSYLNAGYLWKIMSVISYLKKKTIVCIKFHRVWKSSHLNIYIRFKFWSSYSSTLFTFYSYAYSVTVLDDFGFLLGWTFKSLTLTVLKEKCVIF